MVKLRDQEGSRNSEDSKNFDLLMDKTDDIVGRVDLLASEVNNLKMAVKSACVNKKNVTDTLELVEYVKELHQLQIDETQRHLTEHVNRFKDEIDRLKGYADAKAREVDMLEELVINQTTYIDSYEKSMKRVEEYMTNEVHTLHPKPVASFQ